MPVAGGFTAHCQAAAQSYPFDTDLKSHPCRGWDRGIAARLEDAGGTILVDDAPRHSMSFGSPAECFEVTTAPMQSSA